MIRCNTCTMPNTRPDTPFVNGTCAACLSYQKRPMRAWRRREQQLLELLNQHHGQCIVPSSGGKDSTYITLKLLELGADVTVVTASTCHLTPTGRANIDNLARYARTIEITPNRTTRAKLNRLGLEMVGDISWPEHVSIFTTPFKAALDLRIPLIFYGENPQEAYGGPIGSEEASQMTRRWVSEFGGFLGLRPDDLIGQEGLTKKDMDDYLPPQLVYEGSLEAHFLGAYFPWDSHQNARVAIDAGMQTDHNHPPCQASYWVWENLDNAQTGIHDHMMYRKYGYGRLCTQLAVDVRMGLIPRDKALEIVHRRDGLFPEAYCGVPVHEVCDRIGITRQRLFEIMDDFTNWPLFKESDGTGHLILKEA